MEIALAIKNLISEGKKKGAQRVVRGKFKRTAPCGGQFSLFRRRVKYMKPGISFSLE